MSASAFLKVGPRDIAFGAHGGAAIEWSEPRAYTPGTLSDAVEEGLAYPDRPVVRRVEVWLDRGVGQLRTLRDLPRVSSGDLARLVSNHRERFFRPVPGPVVTRAAWLEDADTGNTLAIAGLVPAGIMEVVEAGVARAGVDITCFRLLDGHGIPSHLLRFETDAMSSRARKMQRRRTFLAVAAALAGWGLAAVVYHVDLHMDRVQIEQELASLAGPMARITAIENRLSEFRPIADAIDRQTSGDRWIGDLLSEIGRVLPDSAHLRHFRAERSGAMELEVVAPDAIETYEALHASGSLRGRLAGDPSGEAIGGQELERFSIVFEAPK